MMLNTIRPLRLRVSEGVFLPEIFPAAVARQNEVSEGLREAAYQLPVYFLSFSRSALVSAAAAADRRAMADS